jgi:uncharacterized protein
VATDLRVRDLGTTARIELDRATLDALPAGGGRYREVVALVVEAGFTDVVLDPRGFRSGSMNELLEEPGKYR